MTMTWIDVPETKSRVASSLVTNRQWKQFIVESGYIPSDEDHDGDYPKHWVEGEPKDEDLDKPVGWVSWIQAEKFCKFYGWRLPTEAEMQRTELSEFYEWTNSVSCRCGSFYDARYIRCALRLYFSPRRCNRNVGFRPAQDMETK